MHKRLANLLCLIMGAFALWACGKYAETIETSENEIESIGMESMGSTSVAVEDSGEAEPNNRYSCVASEEGFEITFYSSTNVFSECYPMEPTISQVTENIFEISISVGSPAVYVSYVDIENDERSETFFNPLFIPECNERACVAYMEDGKLILRDIFHEDSLYMTISRDFTKTADPMSAIIAIETQDEGTITLSYYKGENYEETSEVITIY